MHRSQNKKGNMVLRNMRSPALLGLDFFLFVAGTGFRAMARNLDRGSQNKKKIRQKSNLFLNVWLRGQDLEQWLVTLTVGHRIKKD